MLSFRSGERSAMWEKFKNIFKFKNKNPTVERIQMVNQTGNGFYAWSGNLYDSDLVRTRS